MNSSHSCAGALEQRDKRRLGLGLPSAAGRGPTWRRRGPASALGGKPRPGRPWRRRATSSGCCSNRYGEAGAASASSSSFSSFTAVFPRCPLLSKQNRPQHHRRGSPGTRWSRGGSVWGHWGGFGEGWGLCDRAAASLQHNSWFPREIGCVSAGNWPVGLTFQRLRAAVHYTAGCLCQDVAEDKGMRFSKQAIAAIAEITFRQCGTSLVS